MKKKYRIKNRAKNNEFSKLTGIEAYQVLGDKNCLITKSPNALGGRISAQKYAYIVYGGRKKLSKNIKVTSSCGIQNCVLKEHLVATYKPSKVDLDYINNYLKQDNIEAIAFALDVPLEMFKAHQKQLQK